MQNSQVLWMVAGSVDERPGHFILDTGCSMTVVEGQPDELLIVGVDPDGAQIKGGEGVSYLRVGGSTEEMLVAVFETLPVLGVLEKTAGMRPLGLLGNDWLRLTKAVIDADRLELMFK